MRKLATTRRNESGRDKNRIQSRYKVAKKNIRMSDEISVFDGRVLVYRTTHSGDVYQFRMYVESEQRYVRKTLKTRDKEIAIKRAEDLYLQYAAIVRSGEKLFSITASELRERFLNVQQELVDAGQLSQGRWNNIRTFTKHYLEFVGEKTKIQNISEKFFEGYRAFRQKKKKDITMTVVVNESITIKQMYAYAVREGLVKRDYQCDFGKIKVDKNEVKRDGISIEDYRNLTNAARLWYTKTHDGYENQEEESYYRKSVRDFIVLMANFGFRTGELLSLQWKDVQIHHDGTASVTIQAAKTKVRKARTVTGRRGDVFTRRQSYGMSCGGDDFVFSNFNEEKKLTKTKEKQLTKTNLYHYFNELKKLVKKQHSSFNENVDLYDLRHFWITCWLSTGKIDAYQLARYAGTSLIQIQKTYDHMRDSVASKAILGVPPQASRVAATPMTTTVRTVIPIIRRAHS